MQRVKAEQEATENAVRKALLQFLMNALMQLPPKGSDMALDSWRWGVLETLALLKREGLRPMASPEPSTDASRSAAWAVIEAFEGDMFIAMEKARPQDGEPGPETGVAPPAAPVGAADPSAQ